MIWSIHTVVKENITVKAVEMHGSTAFLSLSQHHRIIRCSCIYCTWGSTVSFLCLFTMLVILYCKHQPLHVSWNNWFIRMNTATQVGQIDYLSVSSHWGILWEALEKGRVVLGSNTFLTTSDWEENTGGLFGPFLRSPGSSVSVKVKSSLVLEGMLLWFIDFSSLLPG